MYENQFLHLFCEPLHLFVFLHQYLNLKIMILFNFHIFRINQKTFFLIFGPSIHHLHSIFLI